MTRLTRSNEELTLEEVVHYYEISQQSLLKFKDDILNENTPQIPDHLIGLTMKELNDEFDSYLFELDQLSCFNLLSSTEASLRIDFDQRVNKRGKDILSRRFVEIHRTKANKVSLEEDILQEWKDYTPDNKHIFSNFIGALKYRHWLAHGRYWEPKLPRKFDFTAVQIVCEEIEKVLTEAQSQ